MNSQVGASIIVPSRCGALRLPILLSALSRQDCAGFEVIIVVDGDMDNSAEVLGGVGRRTSGHGLADLHREAWLRGTEFNSPRSQYVFLIGGRSKHGSDRTNDQDCWSRHRHGRCHPS